MNQSAARAIEPLEPRRLLSAVFDVSKVPVYVPTSADINDVKNGPLGNFGSHLASLYSEYKKFVRKGGASSQFATKQETSLQTDGNRVAITVRTRGSIAKLTERLRKHGAELIYRSGIYRTIDAWVPISQLSSLARDAAVLNANPILRPQRFFRGAADNQADIAQNADSARRTFGVDGTGVKVGVISDSVNRFEGGLADSVASGDLPRGVEVIDDSGFSASDEGRAMLELIHDIAPGASLAFASAGFSPTQMADNIVSLVRAGCNIIVDDIGFFDEPLFQESIIGQAITDAVENHGVSYFSSAGNSGASGFQVDAQWVRDINGRLLLDWDRSENVDTRLRVTAETAGLIVAQWDNPYNGVVGAATTDIDINLIDPASGDILIQGGDVNLATGYPIEFVEVPAAVYEIEIAVSDRAEATELPTAVRIRTASPGAIVDTEHKVFRTSSGGHNSGQQTISVGAVPFYLAPPFNDSQTVTNEDFSSLGTATYFFKSNGERREKPLTLLKPDISAIDGVNTSFFGEDIPSPGRPADDKDRLPNFFGTSAAAPNAAAVAALMLEFKPDASPAEIKAALIESARSNPVNNQLKGEYDPQAGFGLIDGLLALRALDPSIVVADIGRVVPDSVPRGIDEVTIRFSAPVTGFDLDDLNLIQSKDLNVDLLDGANVRLVTDDNQTYTLKNLRELTRSRGTYFFQLRPFGITDAEGHPALQGEISFFVSGKPTGLAAIPVTDDEIDVYWTDNNNKEKGYRIYRALNSDFTKGLQTFRVKANTTSFKDTGLSPTTQYFYRVKAIVDDEAPSPTSDIDSDFTLAPNEHVVDNRSADGVSIRGAWEFTEYEPASFGGDYLAASNKKTKSVTFTPDLAAAGTYYVYVRSIKSARNATNVPVDIIVNGRAKETILVNQRNSSGWKLLGQFRLGAGTQTSVRVRNTDANGYVVADAVRFQRTSTAAAGLRVTAAQASSLFSEKNIPREDGVLA